MNARRGWIVAAGVALAWLPPAGARAQEDFRSADAGRPTRVEDAYPVKYLEWEWQAGARSELAEGGELEASASLELKWGIARNAQLGLEVHPAIARAAGVTESGVQAFRIHTLYNFNQEGARMPAFAARADLFAPGTGDAGRDNFGGRVLTLVTRSWGRLRLHGNGGYAWASATDGDDFWTAGLGVDYPIGLFSRAVLADVYAEIPAGPGRARTWAELGARIQWTNALVLDLAVTTRLDQWSDGRSNLGIVLGLSRTFGLAGLVPVPPYPNPRID
ncbi:MAG: hypothetical protein ACREKI_07910 [Gemmatimonadota bacterium]